MTGDRNRLGDAVALLMDAVTLLNNQGEVAKRIDAFLSTIHPAECVELPEETPQPEAGRRTDAIGPATAAHDSMVWDAARYRMKRQLDWRGSATCHKNGNANTKAVWEASYDAAIDAAIKRKGAPEEQLPQEHS